MLNLSVAGFYRELPACISIDPLLLASLTFVHADALPGSILRCVDGTWSHTVRGPVITPSSSGGYTATLPTNVCYLPRHDVVLGNDWLQFTARVLALKGSWITMLRG